MNGDGKGWNDDGKIDVKWNDDGDGKVDAERNSNGKS